MLRLPYGVTRVDVERFIDENEVVKDFLSKFDSGLTGKGTRYQYGYALCRFFKWLRLVKGWDVSPEELLNDQLRRQSGVDINDRRFHVKLVFEHSRDNPDFKSLSDNRKYAVYVAIKGFYEYHEVQLTKAKGKFGKRKKRKYYPKQMTLTDFRKILGVLEQRERTIALMMFQSGLEIGAILYKFNYMWKQIESQLNAGAERIKIEIDERKGNGHWYFTYISRDAIQELKKWLVQRETIIKEAKARFGNVKEELPIFISNNATPYHEDHFFHCYERKLRRNGFKKKPYGKVSHMIRKLFKTEASIPERGIDSRIVEFWMGHTEGVEKVGAEYDRMPEIYEKVIEREYMKLEPFINIYSSSVANRQTDPLLRDIEQLSRLPGVREVFASIVEDAKQKLAELGKGE